MVRTQRRVYGGIRTDSISGPGTGCGIEPLAQCLRQKDREEIQVVEPPEMTRVSDGERDAPAITGSAVGTVG